MVQIKSLMGSGLSAMASTSISGTCGTALTATGSTQATALLLSADVNEVTTTASSTGVQLPVSAIGDEITVGNYGANTLSVYGQTGEGIGSGAANAAFSVAANKAAIFRKVSSTRWIAILSA